MRDRCDAFDPPLWVFSPQKDRLVVGGTRISIRVTAVLLPGTPPGRGCASEQAQCGYRTQLGETRRCLT